MEHRPPAWLAFQVQFPPDLFYAFAHLCQSHVPVPDGLAQRTWIKAHAVVPDCKFDLCWRLLHIQLDPDGARLGVFSDVVERLLDAVRRVHQGEALIDPAVATRLIDEFRRLSQPPADDSAVETLTQAEMDVLRLVAQGTDNREIASQLALSEKTVTNRLSTIYQKLHVNNRTQAALYALRRGWATLRQEEGAEKDD